MNHQQIEEIINAMINRSLEGQEIENPKVDCKRKWYNLTNEKEKHEFLKDTSAIANTVGLDGYIIIGYDDKSKEFFDCTFKDSQLKDTIMLNGIINRFIETSFNMSAFDIIVNGHKLSVLHIPSSFSKPHVISCYKYLDKAGILIDQQHKIFVRKNSGCHTPTKYDLDFMYYDRKNIVPEYDLRINARAKNKNFSMTGFVGSITMLDFNIELIIENIGRRPVAITQIEFYRALYTDSHAQNIIKLSSEELGPLVVNSSEMLTKGIKFYVSGFPSTEYKRIYDHFEGTREITAIKNMTLYLSNTQSISVDFTEFN